MWAGPNARLRGHLPRIRQIFVIAAAAGVPFYLYLWLMERDLVWLGYAGSLGGVAAGALVRLVFQQRQHRLLVGWFNGVAALAALLACAVRFDVWLASLGALILIGELAVAIQQLTKPKVDNAP